MYEQTQGWNQDDQRMEFTLARGGRMSATREVLTTAQELAAAIDAIVAAWDGGDLAGAVNNAREAVEEARELIGPEPDVDLRTELPVLGELVGAAEAALLDEHEGNLRDALIELVKRATVARDMVVNW